MVARLWVRRDSGLRALWAARGRARWGRSVSSLGGALASPAAPYLCACGSAQQNLVEGTTGCILAPGTLGAQAHRSSQVPIRLAACPKLEVLGLIEVEHMCSSMPGSTAAL